MTQMEKVIVAVVQAAPVSFDVRRTLEKRADLDRPMPRGGRARSSCSPKRSSPPIRADSTSARWSDRGPTTGAGSSGATGRAPSTCPGRHVDRLSRIAGPPACYLVIGVIERDGGTLYCTVLFFGPDGGYLGKHRKLMPTASERLVWGFGDGSTLPVFDTAIGRIGAVICWENYMPLLRAAMYAKGDRDLLRADGGRRATRGWRRCGTSRSRGAASCSRQPVRPPRATTRPTTRPFGDDPTTVISRGGSCIIDPLGEVLAGPDYDGETILIAEIDRARPRPRRMDFDAVGHYARPDVFQLVVDESPRAAVAFRATSDGSAIEKRHEIHEITKLQA